MTGWHEGPMLAFDTETTDSDPTTCRIVQLALCRILPGEGAVQQVMILDPGVPISDGARRVHGISNERAQAEGQPTLETLRKVRDEIVTWLAAGRPIVAFNAAFDCTLLEHELARNGLQTVTELAGDFAPVIDPFVIDKHLSYRKGGRKLSDLCAHYAVRIDGAHDAGHDAMAAARVAWRIGQKYPQVAARPLSELHAQQATWRREQCDSLRAYFDKQKKQHDGVDGSWPVRRTALLEVAA